MCHHRYTHFFYTLAAAPPHRLLGVTQACNHRVTTAKPPRHHRVTTASPPRNHLLQPAAGVLPRLGSGRRRVRVRAVRLWTGPEGAATYERGRRAAALRAAAAGRGRGAARRAHAPAIVRRRALSRRRRTFTAAPLRLRMETSLEYALARRIRCAHLQDTLSVACALAQVRHQRLRGQGGRDADGRGVADAAACRRRERRVLSTDPR